MHFLATFTVALPILLLLDVLPIQAAAGTSKFIATVHEDHDPHAVAKDIVNRGESDGDDWKGTVERTHAAIRVIIVNGPTGTCKVLKKIDGIKLCEQDSVVSAYD